MAFNHKENQQHHTVKVIEQCQVGPPPGSVPYQTSIPLTFFDLPWLCCPLIKRIFFYEYPHPTNHFLQKVIPTLKHSLSLALQHFFPFSSNIVFPPKPHAPHILYSEGDTLTFTVAECTTFDFSNLVSDTPRHVTCLHPFVPIMPSARALEDGTLLIPPMAIQVTILPNAGFTICIVFRHVVADGRAFHHFVKCWASVCGSRGDLPLPLHDRGMIHDPNGLKPIFLETLWNVPWESIESMGLARDVPSDMFRRTFVLSRDHAEHMKRYVSAKCQYYGQGTLHVSTFVVTCSLIWVCKVKSEVTNVDATLANDDEELYLLVLADCRNIPELSIPSTYFGNCLVRGNATVKRSKLVGQNGIFEAAVAIGNQVRCLKSEGYKGVETLMSSFSKYATMGQQMFFITGSPKLDVYETDFGCGKPKLSEVVHDSPGLMSLSDCRDKEGGIEVGVALGRTQMEKFNTILEELLTEISVHE